MSLSLLAMMVGWLGLRGAFDRGFRPGVSTGFVEAACLPKIRCWRGGRRGRGGRGGGARGSSSKVEGYFLFFFAFFHSFILSVCLSACLLTFLLRWICGSMGSMDLYIFFV